MQQFRLSARACHRVLKLARAIADLAGSDAITLLHLATGSGRSGAQLKFTHEGLDSPMGREASRIT